MDRVVWFLAAARTVALTGPVELPVVVQRDDPRPRLWVEVGGRPVLARLDAGGHTQVGSLLLVRLGVDERRGRATLDVSAGALALDALRAEVVDGDELVLGLGALDPVAFVLRPDVWVVVRPPDGAALLAEVGETQPVARVDGRFGGWADGDVVGLAPRAGLGVWTPAPPLDRWPASAAAHRARWEAIAAGDVATEPEALVSLERGDPGKGWLADRQLALADARWDDGDVDGAIAAAVAAVRFGRDRCEPWVRLGELLLRADRRGDELVLGVDPAAEDVLARGVALLDAWEAQGPDRYGEHTDVSQPESCRRARGLLDELRGEGLAAAVVALAHGDARGASARIRASYDEHPIHDPWRIVIGALADARLGRREPAAAALARLAAWPAADRPEVAEIGVRVAAALSPDDAGLSALPADGTWSWRAARATVAGEPLPDDLVYRSTYPGRLADPRAPSGAVVALWRQLQAGDLDAARATSEALRRRFPLWAVWGVE